MQGAAQDSEASPPEGARTLADFEHFFTRHHPALLRYAMRRGWSQSDAGEAAADVLRIAWEKAPSFNDAAVPFLYATARNVLMHRGRSAAREAAMRAKLEQPGSRSDVFASAAVDGVRDAVEELPEPTREAVRLVYWDGLTAAQAAAVIGGSEAAMWARLSRARKAMAARLGIDASDEPSTELGGIQDGSTR